VAIAVPTTQSPLDNITYEDLYRRWERGNWQATALDFTRDAQQWQADFSDLERRAAVWNYSLFFWGEDAVADGLSPYIDAAPLEEQKYFLATQQVDEARHAVFFNRFMKEVVGIGGDRVADGLAEIRPQLTWGFNQVFDRLVRMSDELRRDPSIPRLAAAVTLYHVIIEATMAQPGQHFITSYLTDRQLLPGFREGMENVAADEQRHIGFGVKLLSDLRRMDPDVPYAVADLLREVIPWTAAVLVPPEWDMRYIECFGFTLEDLGEEGAMSLETKMRSAGMPIEELPGPPVFPVPGTPRERAERGHRMVRAGYLGEKTGPPSTDAEDMRLLFETIAGGLDSGAAADGGTIQWEFADADPWHVVVDNGATRAEPGRAPGARVTLKSSFEDFVDVATGRKDPKKLALRRRMRLSGDLRWLWRSRAMFPS
jgi:ribonucleotide reductase small subunit/SCP-2 sterol transfer family protein